MFDLGWSEIALVVALAFVIFGPQHIPEIVRSLCGFVRQCRRLYGRWRAHLDTALYDLEFHEGKDLEERLFKGMPSPNSPFSQEHYSEVGPEKVGLAKADPVKMNLDRVTSVDR